MEDDTFVVAVRGVLRLLPSIRESLSDGHFLEDVYSLAWNRSVALGLRQLAWLQAGIDATRRGRVPISPAIVVLTDALCRIG